MAGPTPPAGPSGLGLGANSLQALMLVSGSQPGRTLADDVAAAGIPNLGNMLMQTAAGEHGTAGRCGGGTTCTPLWPCRPGPFTLAPPLRAGTVLKRIPQAADGVPAGGAPMGSYDVNLRRPALQRALYAALPPGTVACGLSLSSFSQREDGKVRGARARLGARTPAALRAFRAHSRASVPQVEVRLAAVGADGTSTAGEERVEVCDVLVGADGIWSRVRAALDGATRGGPGARMPAAQHVERRGQADVCPRPSP